jgi:GTPase
MQTDEISRYIDSARRLRARAQMVPPHQARPPLLDPDAPHTCLIVSMSRPIVAIVGRPNVGKSTLFNRILGWRKAIVDPQSGLTRDRLYGVAEWSGREFTVVDTAGLDLDSAQDESRAAIEAQTRVAIEEAQVIVLVLDVREGLTAVDRDIARLLRRSGRHVFVAANKADSPTERHFAHELLELGFDEPHLISAQHGVGIGDFLDAVLAELPAAQEPAADDNADRIAIMGRPNVGKSSLLNALLGDERALVSATPGTTRDPVDTELIFDNVPVVLVDTAGIRRKSSNRDRLERYSLLRGIRAMERADAVLLVVDASAGALAQDRHVAGYALEAGKGLVIVVNKIDLVEPAERKAAHWRETLAKDFKFAPFAPVVAVSARTKEGMEAVLPAALEVIGHRRIKMPTNELNKLLREAVDEHPPPSFKGRRLKIAYATQAGTESPTVVLFVNDVGLLHFSYRRYLEKKIRDRFGLMGNPLKLVLRSERSKKEESGRRGVPARRGTAL